ncbi:unnamed protein product [marine sediment metagenome]|uniref:Uncharacterized protein n=1 Tax=marine sediment metagenome TaxID=412755 RepID=X1B7T0_9ZZZZ
MSEERTVEEKTVEERLDQIEKDIEDITSALSGLLTWKRNQITRTLPITHPKAARAT